MPMRTYSFLIGRTQVLMVFAKVIAAWWLATNSSWWHRLVDHPYKKQQQDFDPTRARFQCYCLIFWVRGTLSGKGVLPVYITASLSYCTAMKMMPLRLIKLHQLTALLMVLTSSWAPGVSAQCDGATCGTCLEGFNCVWNVADAGTCQEACGGFPNVDCFYARTFAGGTAAQICEAATNKVEENKVCFSKTTAESCLQQAGCDWVNGRKENGENGNWCALDIDYTPPAIPCSADNCNGCLADNSCVWMKGDTCSNSCDNFPNINCYYRNMFGATPEDSAAICNVANNSMTEHEACFMEASKDTCFQIDGCVWIVTGDETGFCSLGLSDGDSGSGSSLSAVRRSILLASSIAATFLLAVWG